MEISQLVLLRLLLYSFFFGLATGIFYDVNRIFRVLCGVRYSKRIFTRLYEIRLPIVKRKLKMGISKGFFQSLVINVGDLFCVLFAASGLIVLNYSYNSGRFRFFTVIGVCLGFLFYRFTVGKLLIRIVEPIAFILKYLILSFFIVFSRPFIKIGIFVGKKVKKSIYLYSFTLEKKRRKLYNIEGEVFASANGEESLPAKDSRIRIIVRKGRADE